MPLPLRSADMHRILRPMRSVLEKAIATTADGAASAKYLRDVHSHLVQILEDIDEGVSECRDLAEHYSTKVGVCGKVQFLA